MKCLKRGRQQGTGVKLVIATVCAIVGGCAGHGTTNATTRPTTMPVASIDLPVIAFEDLLRRDGALTFRSWEGKRIGMDCDTDLRFFPGGKLEMVECGLGVVQYEGTYRLDFDGLLTTKFEGYDRWPVMRLGSDERSLVLSRSDGRRGMGWDGHQSGMTDGKSYWPFRPASKDTGMAGIGALNCMCARFE